MLNVKVFLFMYILNATMTKYGHGWKTFFLLISFSLMQEFHLLIVFLQKMSSRKTAGRRGTTKKRAQRGTSNVFAMFDWYKIRTQLQEDLLLRGVLCGSTLQITL